MLVAGGIKQKLRRIFFETPCMYIYVVGSKNLCGLVLPFVAQADHLDSIITERGNMEQDA